MTELTTLRGIGKKTAEALKRLGIFSAEDLVWHYPRDYEIFETPIPIYQLENGKTGTVEGVLFSPPALIRFGSRTIINAYISDMTGKLKLSWFNSPFIINSIKIGTKYIFRGRIYEKNGLCIMNQPRFYEVDTYFEKYAGKMMPIYPLTKGLSNNYFMKLIAEALNKYQGEAEFLPEDIRERYNLIPEETALIRLHFPRSKEELILAKRRLVFNEFFMNLLAGEKILRSSRLRKSNYKCKPDYRIIDFMAKLPFELTKDQLKAYKDITNDMNSSHPMNRLLEGDVGSGKTIVAVLSMIYAYLNGYQAAIMAPTSVLATQHFQTILKLLKTGSFPDLHVAFLSGHMTPTKKQEIHKQIAEGQVNIIVGTHALFQEKVKFSNLGLIVTDEQHRFGVGQRETFAGKGDMPHTLIMSATPIPRTLSMILYRNMDVSLIEHSPKGRIPIKNCVVTSSYRPAAYKFIASEVKKGHQAYIICPQIEPDSLDTLPGSDLENVVDYTIKLKKFFRGALRIEALHGHMKSDEKDRIMAAFKDKKADILVSTTVIEVGVDVPNATVMMIENAEQFGLAQLHQLRGRVGRGNFQSYCIMINTSKSDKASQRLEILNHSNDGFFIAEQDLRLRGPGDIFGTRQSGDMDFKIADIYKDADVLKLARLAVDEMLKNDPELEKIENQSLRHKLSIYFEKGYVL